MPKAGRGKGAAKGTPKRGPKGKGRMSDEESMADTASVVSMSSERGSYDDGDNCNDDYDECSSSASRDVTVFGESLEDKVAEAIDQLNEKSANLRASAYATLSTNLSANYRPEMILSRRETLRDCLERALKRGGAVDQLNAASIYALSILQVAGVEPDLAQEDFNVLRPTLLTLVADHTASFAVRAKAAEALGLGGLLAETCLADVANLVAALEPLFGPQRMKELNKLEGAGGAMAMAPPPSPAKGKSGAGLVKGPGALAAAAIASWSLLLTVMGREYLQARVHRWTSILLNLLDQNDIDIKVNAGEALAILVELCELADEDETEEDVGEEEYPSSASATANGYTKPTNMKELVEKLRKLSTESHKYTAKKDKRQLHHCFRDFLHAVEDGEGPGISTKFGNSEYLEIDSWAKKRQYDAITKVVSSGLNTHLSLNPLVRQVLELGAPRPVIDNPNFDSRAAKSERQYMNALNFKARSVNRGKNRDHRMAALEGY